ncbi:MAG: tetratricopeptide repeat protein [Gammaproteobacteria bacterium]|nr:tetratricopeptide repeat protein [Gammaproteobacteria bacterium]
MSRTPINSRTTKPPGSRAQVDRGLLAAVLVVALTVLLVASWIVYAVVIAPQPPRTDVERQVQKLEALSKTQPENPRVWADWATALIAAGDLSKAATVIEAGSAEVTETAPILLAEAKLLDAQSRRSEALGVLDMVIDKMLKREQDKRSEFSETGTSIDIATLASPYLIEAYVLQGELLSSEGDIERAASSYTSALARNPQMADVLTMRGDLYATLGRMSEAEGDYRKALSMIPDYADALAGLNKLGKAGAK